MKWSLIVKKQRTIGPYPVDPAGRRDKIDASCILRNRRINAAT